MKRCLNCMEVYDEQYEICPYCGFKRGTPPKVASHLMPGTIIAGRYIIGTVIGYGGFGVTYLAWDEELGIKIAIKEYYPNGLVNRVPGTKEVIVLGGNKKDQYILGLQRFLEEARTVAKFANVPNIVHVYNFLEENNTAYIMMEYLEGVTLKDYLMQFEDQRMAVDDAVSVTLEVGKALREIHKAKIVHRDISPDNIYLCTDGKIKVLDFGAARLSAGEVSQTLSIVLKPGYAPPEQYRKKSKQGPRTDVYALSATLYKAVTGKLPPEALDRLVEDTIVKPSEINPEVPQWLDTVILTGMAKNAEVRFASADKLIEALQQGKRVSLPEKKIKKKRTIRAVSAIAIALIVGIAGYKYFGMYSDISGEGVPDGEITMLVPVASAEDENRYKEFKEGFETKFSGKKLNVQFVDAGSYGQTLNESITSESAPDLFAGNYLSSENQGKKQEVKSLLKDLNLRTLYLYKENKETIEKAGAVPLGADAYVLYENTYLTGSDEGSFVKTGGADINSQPADSKLFDGSITAASSGIFEEISGRESAKAEFLEEKLTYYIGSIKEKQEIQKALSGYVETTAITDDGKAKGNFCHWWSVNSDSEKGKKKIAELALKYALSEEGQNILCVRNQGMIPVNKKAFSLFKEINKSLAFIEPEKIEVTG